MGNGYPVIQADPMAQFVADFQRLRDRVKTLEMPSGTQTYGAVAKVKEAINSIGTLVDNYLATGFTTGSMTATGDVTAAGNVTGSNVTGGNVFAQSLATNITATRVQLWGRTSDGYIATAASSQRFKSALRAVDVDERAKRILQIVVGYFEYLAEVARRDDPSSPDYAGPDYHVGTNLGAIAEQLHELGLWEWVVYEREPVTASMTDEDGIEHEVITGDNLKLDEEGEPIPYGIHDGLIGWASIIVDQYQEKRLAKLEEWALAQGFEVYGSR